MFVADETLPDPKARSFLRDNGAKFEEVDLCKGLSEAQIEHLIGRRNYKLFLNPRNELYRARDMKNHSPARA